MSLTVNDLQAIRTTVREEIRDEVPKIVRKIIGEEVPVIILQIMHAEVPLIVRNEVKRQVGPLESRLMAVENDVKEICFMMSDPQQRLPVRQTQS